jgi:hypothetical protein
MRCYYTTTVDRFETILEEGFKDLYSEFGMRGVYFSTIPLEANDGFEGDVTICLDVPQVIFDTFDVTDTMQEKCGYRLALVPAVELNMLGTPQVYDHTFSGSSRVMLMKSIRNWEQSDSKVGREHGARMRAAVEFFDRIGWLTPIKVREQGGIDG